MNREKAVRTRATFGQLGWWKRKSCPNQSHLRTAWVVKEEKLSESEATSDRLSVKRGKAVRIMANFGQVKC
ncbi:hypothetical protein [Cytobacillus oceanisediminis]|uniref:hypothetical protein n=1 Tax=Cytobacillus oceanisediminis TaxID=665099 RepID=UPI0011A54E67|nr:hypothetical protein [Cytobacillus oceanisediminis]